MSYTVLRPADSKQARRFAEVSQNTVARATGISRTTLALFEVEKYLLDDATLEVLRDYYAGLGYEFTEEAGGNNESISTTLERSEAKTSVRLIDGFAVPAGLDLDDVEDALAQIAANDELIGELSEQKTESTWLFNDPETDKRDKAVLLLARNYLLTRQLQGHKLLGIDIEPDTNGALLQSLLLSKDGINREAA